MFFTASSSFVNESTYISCSLIGGTNQMERDGDTLTQLQEHHKRWRRSISVTENIPQLESTKQMYSVTRGLAPVTVNWTNITQLSSTIKERPFQPKLDHVVKIGLFQWTNLRNLENPTFFGKKSKIYLQFLPK